MIGLGVLIWIFLCIICEWLFRWFDENNVIARPIWKSMYKLSMYQNCQKTDLSNTEWLYSRVMNVPSSPIIN
jgi:dTDP-4-amino-4,6-dideoxygalactose transaminase